MTETKTKKKTTRKKSEDQATASESDDRAVAAAKRRLEAEKAHDELLAEWEAARKRWGLPKQLEPACIRVSRHRRQSAHQAYLQALDAQGKD